MACVPASVKEGISTEDPMGEVERRADWSNVRVKVRGTPSYIVLRKVSRLRLHSKF